MSPDFICPIGSYFRLNEQLDCESVLEDCNYCKLADRDKLDNLLNNSNSKRINLEDIGNICVANGSRISFLDLEDSIKRYFHLIGITSNIKNYCEKLNKEPIFFMGFSEIYF